MGNTIKPASLETCTECCRDILPFETPCIYQERIVCPACHERLITAPSSVSSPPRICDNCSRQIGKLETHSLFNGQTVCRSCAESLHPKSATASGNSAHPLAPSDANLSNSDTQTREFFRVQESVRIGRSKAKMKMVDRLAYALVGAVVVLLIAGFKSPLGDLGIELAKLCFIAWLITVGVRILLWIKS